ncbi:MAG: DUF2480 family protein [Candidatus Eisenbacteria bacterium]|nr:DUF2480 family protein [Candidatus Eisenbacteria bacterium]
MSAPSAGARVTFDLSEVLPGRVEEAAFKAALEGHDWTRYRGAELCLTGCAPLWTYVYVAVRAAEHAATVSVDDGSENGVRVR